MKIMTVVGARPQFIKEAVVSKEIRRRHEEILVHTGQHYDYEMSQTFFDQLEIPKPNYNLGISGGSHAEMTAKMMMALERVAIKERPDWGLLYGDTNSTLAAALVFSKLRIPICHVEAGIRTHSMTNPEEINRVCTDHVSALLLAATESSMKDMMREGIVDKAILVGDPMFEAFLRYKDKKNIDEIKLESILGGKVAVPKSFYYLTCHREENTEIEKLREILEAMNSLDSQTVYPVHPRNTSKILKICEEKTFENIIFSKPVGYLESLSLTSHAKKIVTDSGGLQREAFFAGKQCVTILNFVCWPETMVHNMNVLAAPRREDILDKLKCEGEIREGYYPFGDGRTSVKIVDALENYKVEIC